MMNSIYFADWGGGPAASGRPRLATGWCFDAAGLPVVPGPRGAGDCEGIILDDRNPPAKEAAAKTARLLETIRGPVICDFERPPAAGAEAVIRALAGREVVVPEAYAHLPHTAVLVGPYRPGIGFLRWMDEKKTRYGRVVLDGAKIAYSVRMWGMRADVGIGPREESFRCPGAMCLYRREGAAFVFFDTEKTLLERAEAAGCPVIICNDSF